jgi:hypothetical protein
MAVYTPGHDCFVAYLPETTAPSSVTDLQQDWGTAPVGSPVLIGHTDVPPWVSQQGSRKIFGLGSPYAISNGKGRRGEEITLDIKITYAEFIERCLPDANGLLENLAIYVGVYGVWTKVIRHAKCNQISFSINSQDDSEVTVSVQILGLGLEDGSVLTRPSNATLRELGSPLYFHSLKTLVMGATSYRKGLMGLTVTSAHNLEVKGVRYEQGDNVVTSRAAYELLPHTINVSGELVLHEKFADALFTGTANATHEWSDIVATLNDTPVAAEDEERIYVFTIDGPIPVSRGQNAVDVSGQANYTIPFLADRLILTQEDAA